MRFVELGRAQSVSMSWTAKYRSRISALCCGSGNRFDGQKACGIQWNGSSSELLYTVCFLITEDALHRSGDDTPIRDGRACVQRRVNVVYDGIALLRTGVTLTAG